MRENMKNSSRNEDRFVKHQIRTQNFNVAKFAIKKSFINSILLGIMKIKLKFRKGRMNFPWIMFCFSFEPCGGSWFYYQRNHVHEYLCMFRRDFSKLLYQDKTSFSCMCRSIYLSIKQFRGILKSEAIHERIRKVKYWHDKKLKGD